MPFFASQSLFPLFATQKQLKLAPFLCYICFQITSTKKFKSKKTKKILFQFSDRRFLINTR